MLAAAVITAAAPVGAAVHHCTVNDVGQPGDSIAGTDGPDKIICLGGIPTGGTVDGKGGDDTIAVLRNAGTVLGGLGDDKVRIGAQAESAANDFGLVGGGPGDDAITIGSGPSDDLGGHGDLGTVDAGYGRDTCTFHPRPEGRVSGCEAAPQA
ncbi:hypothetical protein ACFQ08_21425 [Streptosporangium algeriense]|uniref:Calcium-binding protein n=1 Tax=Streptosporangium algeriense TaxID=1682748 RepID=A0ABW3DVL1_9ACTN